MKLAVLTRNIVVELYNQNVEYICSLDFSYCYGDDDAIDYVRKSNYDQGKILDVFL